MTATQESPVKGLTPNIDVAPVHKRRPSRAPWPLNLYATAVGKKWVMAITGIGLMGFVFAHMVGNLKMYLNDGGKEFNEYSDTLRSLLYPIMPNGVVLWLMRIGLIVMFLIHLHAAYSLTVMNRRARPTSYSRRDYIAASFAARTMRVSGILVLAFLIMHLGNLTWGWWLVKTPPGFEEGQAYANLVNSLSQPLVGVLYIIGNVALAFHLFHGAWSIFQSLGANNPRYNGLRKGFAYGFTALVCGINISFPIMIMAGVVKLPAAG